MIWYVVDAIELKSFGLVALCSHFKSLINLVQMFYVVFSYFSLTNY